LLARAYPVEAIQRVVSNQATSAANTVGVRIAVQFESEDAVRSRLASAAAAKQLPDIGLIGGPDLVPLVARGWLRNVKDSLDRIAGLNGDLFPPLRDLTIGGPFVDRPPHQQPPVWLIPHLSVPPAWLVRSDLQADSGLDVPKTFDDARALSKKVAKPSEGRFGWGGPLPTTDAADNFVQATLLDYGAVLFDSNGYRIDLNPVDAVPGLGALASLYRDESGAPLAPPGALDWAIDDVATALGSGQVAQAIDHGGAYARIAGQGPALTKKIRAMPLPKGDKSWFTTAVTSGFVVFDSPTNGERAGRFVEALLQPKGYESLVSAGLGAVVPPYAYLMRVPFWDHDPNYQAFAAGARGDPSRSFQYATLGQPAPLTLPVASVRAGRVFVAVARAVALGEQPPIAAAQTLREQAMSLVGSSYALQPRPTPTPLPGWYRLLEEAQRVLK
jgi:ABC-type glycerol-3-phosphate transport system substrate-binding protein